MRTALVIGVSGQDGAYLARLLAARGYRIIGASRDAAANGFERLHALGVASAVETITLDATSPDEVAGALRAFAPDEIYNLGGQSSVAASFAAPTETVHGIVCATETLLEAIRRDGRPMRFYSAGSSEAFGDIGDRPADEATGFNPKSPYGVAKASAFWQVANYRSTFGLFAVTGIAFNHESRLRPDRFVIPKVIAAARAICAGEASELVLGDIDVERDWGWAPEYVEAMWMMLQQERPRDYVIATGHSMSLRRVVAEAFGAFGLDWQAHVRQADTMLRPNELRTSHGNPARAQAELGWRATTFGGDLIRTLAGSAARPQ